MLTTCPRCGEKLPPATSDVARTAPRHGDALECGLCGHVWRFRLAKQRIEQPGWMTKPGSRTAFTRGCKCSVLPALESEMRLPDGVGWIHADKCPLRKRDTNG